MCGHALALRARSSLHKVAQDAPNATSAGCDYDGISLLEQLGFALK